MNILFTFTFQMDLSPRVSFEYDCGGHKVYLNFWVTDFGGCDMVQIKANISVFGWDCPSPLAMIVPIRFRACARSFSRDFLKVERSPRMSGAFHIGPPLSHMRDNCDLTHCCPTHLFLSLLVTNKWAPN